MLKPHILISFVFILSIGACKKKCQDAGNPECENFNPCHSKSRVKADFKIEEELGPLMSETDTAYSVNIVRFTPIVEFDSLKWFIGSQIFTDKSIGKRGFPPSEWISITLIVYRQPHLACFPDDDGVDTLTKQFYSASREELLVFGYFQGYNTDNPKDTFTVQTVTDGNFGYSFDLRNLPKGTSGQFFVEDLFYGGRVAYSKDTSPNNEGRRFALESTITVKNSAITIDYSYDQAAYNAWLEGEQYDYDKPSRVSKTFIGKKLY